MGRGLAINRESFVILFQARNERGSVVIENIGSEPYIRTWLHITQPDAFGFERPTLSMNWPKGHPETKELLEATRVGEMLPGDKALAWDGDEIVFTEKAVYRMTYQ